MKYSILAVFAMVLSATVAQAANKCTAQIKKAVQDAEGEVVVTAIKSVGNNNYDVSYYQIGDEDHTTLNVKAQVSPASCKVVLSE